jgi:hypothetical protein
MGQRINDVAVMDALTKPNEEKCAGGTMGAQIVLILEERARGTVQRSNDAAVKDALSGGADGHFTVVECCPAEEE